MTLLWSYVILSIPLFAFGLKSTSRLSNIADDGEATISDDGKATISGDGEATISDDGEALVSERLVKPPADKNIKKKELELIYGKGAPQCPRREVFLKGLEFWNQFAKSHKIDYALAYGTAIGNLRHPESCILPYEHDVDLFVGKNTSAILSALAAAGGADVYVGGTAVPYTPTVDKPLILMWAKYNDSAEEGRPLFTRYNCKGHRAIYQEDSCSFATFLARVLFGEFWMDLFEFHYDTKANAPKPKEPTYPECVATPKTYMHCCYVPTSMAMALPTTRDCTCGDVQLRCLPRDVDEDVLSGFYPGFITPDKMWNGSHYAAPA